MNKELIINNLTSAYQQALDDKIAQAQSAYMRDQFPFFGIMTKNRDIIHKYIIKQADITDQKDLIDLIYSLWSKQERDYHYFASDLAIKYKKICDANFIETIKFMIINKSWWDTVDNIAVNILGPLIEKHPELSNIIDTWVTDSNFWVRRSALLFQLRYKKNTDAAKLFSYCKQLAHEKEFFIRKAIGWVLREYSKTDPVAVKEFIAQNKNILSPLSIKEGSKYT